MPVARSSSYSRPRRASWLLLDLGEGRGRTLRQQLREALKEAVRSGRLPAGTVLPPTRSLAADLNVSRGVVVEVYTQLCEEGFLAARPGSGTVVTQAGGQILLTATARGRRAGWRATAPPPPAYAVDLRPGPPDLASFPRAYWLAAMREVLRALPDAELGYVPPWGVAALREELSTYLSRVRGAMVPPDELLIVSGVTQGLALLARVLVRIGYASLAVESPSNAAQRLVLGSYGLRIVDVPVDSEGLDVAALTDSGCRAVLVTPAHQYPCGVALSPARRSALMHWAENIDGLVIEDDYDSEFRYDRKPIGCLQGLAPHRVALVGSVSKSLAPGLRLGWLAAPAPFQPLVMAAKRDDDFGTPVLGQHTLARLIADGRYDRHVRRVRRRYMERRDGLVRALGRELPSWEVSGSAAGLHVLAWLPPELDEERLLAGAAAAGVVPLGTRPMYGSLPPRDGVVIGYARAPVSVLTDAVHRLAGAVTLTRNGGAPDASSEVRPATALDYF